MPHRNGLNGTFRLSEFDSDHVYKVLAHAHGSVMTLGEAQVMKGDILN